MVQVDYSTPNAQPQTDSPHGLSLSSYFPAGTHYFYGYPAGDDSGFFNNVPAYMEELVAARAFCCAGPTVNVVCFAAAAAPKLPTALLDTLGLPYLSQRQLCVLPADITAAISGKARNTAIKEALLHELPPASLVMAQPYTDAALAPLFQIPPTLTNWLNDKANLPHIIPPTYLPTRLAAFASGAAFAEQAAQLALPCVVKVSSSSSGDGVYLCHTPEDLQQAARAVAPLSGGVTAEQFISAKHNYAVHFGIPHDPSQPAAILGVNEQLTTPEGSFVGGIISGSGVPEKLAYIAQLLQETILPNIRQLGWYGIAGIDVLEDETGNFYFIDGNFRMTGMSAYHLLCSQGALQAPLVSFHARFTGSRSELEAALAPLTNTHSARRIATLIALSQHNGTWHVNGAIMFANQEELQQRAQALLHAGLRSEALELVR